jgi:hypothetical protein
MLLDTTNGFLESLFANDIWVVVLIRAVGSGLLAYYYNPNINSQPLKTEDMKGKQKPKPKTSTTTKPKTGPGAAQPSKPNI